MSAPQTTEQERAETLMEIARYFKNEMEYELANIGAGGSRIAAGKWERYYRAADYMAMDLPELAVERERASRYFAEAQAERDSLLAQIASLREALTNLLCMLPSEAPKEQDNERIPPSFCAVRWIDIREARAALKQVTL